VTGLLHTIPVPGAVLVVEAQGEGAPPLVLIHGFGDDRHIWDRLSAALSQRRQVVRYDLRGFGDSVEHGNAPFRHSRDLLSILDTLGIPQCDLLGASMGGSVALSFALDFPARVRRLILISPGIVGWEWSPAWNDRWALITEAARKGEMASAHDLWWNHPLFETTRANPAAGECLRRSISRYSGRHWVADNEQPSLPDLDRLPALAVPTLLLTGSCDLPDFRLIADLIAGAAPDVSRFDVEGAGHLLHLERPQEVIIRIAEFLA